MSLPKIKSIRGTGVYIPGDEIDTDRIIPARFMKCVTFDGLGPYAFYDERKDEEGNDKEHPLNTEHGRRAPILISGSNFGCGSSREHAPQSLYHWGIRGMIAESFAEIFFGNATTLGIPCVQATSDNIQKLTTCIQSNPESAVTIDLEQLQAYCEQVAIPIQMPNGARESLLNGKWDPIAELLDDGGTVDEVAKQQGYASPA